MNYELAAALGIETEPTEYYNLQNVQRQLNALKLVTNEAAKTLINGARTTLDKALSVAGSTGNEMVMQKVSSDADKIREQLLAFSVGPDPDETFPNGSALKSLYVQSFVTYNAALQGKRTAESLSYFREVMERLGELAQKTEKTGKEGTSLLKYAFGFLAVGVGGYVAYQIFKPKRSHYED